MGSSLSVVGLARLGASLSVESFGNFGSSLSLRSFARLGSSLSVLDFANFGSSLSLRSFARFGSTIQVYDKITFSSTDTYLEQVGGTSLDWYVAGEHALSMQSTGGILHGVWMANTPVTTSDRRMKTNIQDLHDTINTVARDSPGTRSAEDPLGNEESSSRWLLRELRPVSYNFKQGSESRHVRFGFIADEMEKVLPQVIRTLPRTNETKAEQAEEEPKKGIVYTDLIAVLATMMKELGNEVKDLTSRIIAAETELDHLERFEAVT